MTELMPHVLTPDSHFYHPWPPSKVSQRTLPPPSNTNDSTLRHKLPLPASMDPPTPPPTSHMNSFAHYEQRPQDMSYPVRLHTLPSQPVSNDGRLDAVIPSTDIRSSPHPISTLAQGEPEARKSPSHSNTVTPAFKLPSTIDAPQATLPQLTAEAACLFWFENLTTLKRIEKHTTGSPVSPNALNARSIPSTSFRKWVVTLLATTQVTQNVILLALFFIYKLKSFNPTVKAGPNSEYKLLTVALMLGNKFLDDNTYTNKTWAEVSGMSVQDVHVMEVEFLSNMRYSLFTSEQEWKEWHEKLGKFGRYIDMASKAREAAATRATLLTPTNTHFSALLSSPPNPYLQSNTPVLLPLPGSSAISPIGPLPDAEHRFLRKRSYDENVPEPPAKRLATANYQNSLPSLPTMPATQPTIAQPQPLHAPVSLPSLPMPVTSQTMPMQLPVLGSRAMSLVYQPPVQFQPHVSQAAPMVPPIQTSGLPQPNILHPDHTRQLSPYPINSGTSSPINPAFTSNNQRHSPSYFLAQRSSPYRPVRQVQTLLAPPSSTPLYNAPRLITHEQMQYHPLGRPFSERRIGHLPYLNHDAWPQTHQFNQWSEMSPLPPPNFHA